MFVDAPVGREAPPGFQTGNEPRCGARAELTFQRKQATTVLARCRSTAPLRVAPPVDLAGCAYTTIVNITGGVAAGDAFDQRIDIGANAHALVTTPSAAKVYGSTGATARSATRITVGSGAVVEWVPDLVMPFAGARYEQTLTVDVESGGAVIVADMWAAGRVAQGEHWAAWLNGTCRIDLCGTTVYRDAFAITPDHAACFEGWPYLATWVAVADRPIDWEQLATRLVERTDSCEPRVYGGASTICRGGVVARFVASSAPALTETSDALWSEIRQALLGVPRPHLRKY